MHLYFGGSFDPPHIGHDQLLSHLLTIKNIKAVHVVPTGQNPLKDHTGLLTAKQRQLWVKSWLAAHNSKKIQLQDLEIKAQGKSYTFDTITKLKKNYDGPWALVMGSDLCPNFKQWHRWQGLLDLFDAIFLFPRKGYPQKNISDFTNEYSERIEIKWLDCKIDNISSTQIRNEISNGEKNLALPKSLLSLVADLASID